MKQIKFLKAITIAIVAIGFMGCELANLKLLEEPAYKPTNQEVANLVREINNSYFTTKFNQEITSLSLSMSKYITEMLTAGKDSTKELSSDNINLKFSLTLNEKSQPKNMHYSYTFRNDMKVNDSTTIKSGTSYNLDYTYSSLTSYSMVMNMNYILTGKITSIKAEAKGTDLQKEMDYKLYVNGYEYDYKNIMELSK